MGRAAQGVKAMNLKKGDELVGADVVPANEKPARTTGAVRSGGEAELLAVTENGFGKKTALKEYRVQKRGGSGIKTAKITPKTGSLVAAKVIGGECTELIAISKKGQVIRTPLNNISTLSRATQGVRIMKLAPQDALASITCL